MNFTTIVSTFFKSNNILKSNYLLFTKIVLLIGIVFSANSIFLFTLKNIPEYLFISYESLWLFCLFFLLFYIKIQIKILTVNNIKYNVFKDIKQSTFYSFFHQKKVFFTAFLGMIFYSFLFFFTFALVVLFFKLFIFNNQISISNVSTHLNQVFYFVISVGAILVYFIMSLNLFFSYVNKELLSLSNFNIMKHLFLTLFNVRKTISIVSFNNLFITTLWIFYKIVALILIISIINLNLSVFFPDGVAHIISVIVFDLILKPLFLALFILLNLINDNTLYVLLDKERN